jgi:epoxyqueuosine reductase QueG
MENPPAIPSVNKERLSQRLKDFLLRCGVCAVGISTVETLKGGPPSTDLTYVLPNAKSAVSFALPMDLNLIEPWLRKTNHDDMERNIVQTDFQCSGIATTVSRFLIMQGFPSYPVPANINYRMDTPEGALLMHPELSHRYLAVRSGVGHFGLSGNLIVKEYGAAVLLGSVVTKAELVPTDPLPEEDNYCDECGICKAVCPSGYFSTKENIEITMGGKTFSYGDRTNNARCGIVCGGFTGLHPSGKWSTWSPGRFTIPEKDEDFLATIFEILARSGNRPKEGEEYHPGSDPDMDIPTGMTCGFCQFVCAPQKEERKKRMKMIKDGGVVVQNADGSLEAVSPEVAQERLARMTPEQRRLYED